MSEIIIQSKYKYKLILSENYLCVPYTLKMVIDAAIGNEISVEKIISFFRIIRPSDTEDINQYGAIIKNGDINALFNSLSIPLREEYIPINTISEDSFAEIIIEQMSKGNHLIFGYSYGYLYDEEEYLKLGHVSIISEINSDTIKLLNPGPNNAGSAQFSTDKIYTAIRMKKDGLWVIKPI